MPNTNSTYPTGDQATVIPSTANPAPNPLTGYQVTAPTGGTSPGSVQVPASTAPTAVPIAMQQQQAVYNQLPNYSGSLANVGANINSETAGQLPQDVVNQLTQQAAERGIATGTAGSANMNANLMQALGLNSLALTQQGQQNLEGILPTLAGNSVAKDTSLYATPGLYEAASANAAGVGNNNALQSAELANALAAQSANKGSPYQTIDPTGAQGGAAQFGGTPTTSGGPTKGATGTTGTGGTNFGGGGNSGGNTNSGYTTVPNTDGSAGGPTSTPSGGDSYQQGADQNLAALQAATNNGGQSGPYDPTPNNLGQDPNAPGQIDPQFLLYMNAGGTLQDWGKSIYL